MLNSEYPSCQVSISRDEYLSLHWLLWASSSPHHKAFSRLSSALSPLDWAALWQRAQDSYRYFTNDNSLQSASFCVRLENLRKRVLSRLTARVLQAWADNLHCSCDCLILYLMPKEMHWQGQTTFTTGKAFTELPYRVVIVNFYQLLNQVAPLELLLVSSTRCNVPSHCPKRFFWQEIAPISINTMQVVFGRKHRQPVGHMQGGPIDRLSTINLTDMWTNLHIPLYVWCLVSFL